MQQNDKYQKLNKIYQGLIDQLGFNQKQNEDAELDLDLFEILL